MRDHFTLAATAGLAFVGALAVSAPAFAHAPLETGLYDKIYDSGRFAGDLVAAGKAGHGHNLVAAASGPISVEGAFARATPGAARNGGAFLVIRNTGAVADRLVAVKSDVAARAELHTHLHEGGVMKMRPIAAVEVPAGGEASLQPGGDHIMLLGLKAPLKEGESFAITLIFETAGEISVTVPVGGVGAMGVHQGMHNMHKKN